ncbi:hypothetical protein ACOMHN_012024 [Nucella lapillus]
MEAEEPLQPPGPARPRRNRPLKPAVLREMLQDSAEHIMLRLASPGGGLEQLVGNAALDDESILLLLRLIHKSFTPHILQSCHEQVRTVIDTMLNNHFLHFILLAFLRQDGGRSQEDKRTVVAGTLGLVDFALNISPTTAYHMLFMFPALLREKLRELPDADLMRQLERTEASIEGIKTQALAGKKSKSDRVHGMRLQADDGRAEENFRALPLIPTVQDLTSNDEIFVRRNRESGCYDNLEDYLDVQFRLFRADFVIPLRESILKYLGSEDAEAGREGGRGVRVYRDVQIVRPLCSDRDLAYRIAFDVACFPSVDWRSTQRLKYGSLLCLSSDKFHTCLYAVVKEHDAAQLSNGLVDVIFILDRDELAQVIDVPRDRRFVMVESPAYFEAYRHVLQGLKNLNDQNFPFVRYIVQCQSDINPPRYLQLAGNVKYDFRPLLDDKFMIQDEEDRAAAALADLGLAGDTDIDEEEVARNIAAGGVDVMSDHEWPSHSDLKLDETQYRALRNALTRECALVQGPPGTGKTYLGLKVLKMLLHNSQVWNDPGHRRPLLIVCYTNHALDQFLEAVLDFFQGSLVRVGGRSTSERLKEVNLTNFRRRAKETRKVPMEVHEAKMRARLDLRKQSVDVHGKAVKLEVVEQEIVKEDFLQDFIPQSFMDEFKRCFRRGEEGSAILKWLKLEMVHERLKYQAEHRGKTLPSIQVVVEDRQGSRSLSLLTRFEDPYDEEDDDDDDDETISVAFSFRDSTQSRKLDIDDDDDDEFMLEDLDLDFAELEREETESEKVRRRLRQVEAETLTLRRDNIALDVSGFCAELEDCVVQDRTVSKRNKEKDREVAENLRKLTLQYKRRLQALVRSLDKMTLEESEQVQSVWALKVKDRWRLYRLWTDLYCKQTRGDLRQQEERYFDSARKYREILAQEDKSILEKQTVVGMTTTGAARYQAILQAIGPRVIVVEEAAEVFEAHVVATLSDNCQHLILIGDHKQLRPNPTVYDLAKKANLDVSLFERMVRNNFPLDCLGYQHRMRPEISRMMKLPDLYPQLQDHEVVKNMPAVKGVGRVVYYVSHSFAEERDEETKSYSNPHEATFLVALCEYLLKQGYRHDQITILTPYSGQIRLMSQEMPRRTFEGVRVSSVDNYQGEENDIVLLSLVRSNSDNDIGFLKFDNRICVALSRAKMGLYVIGNFELLQNSSGLLRDIVHNAYAQKIVGEGLPLSCQNHPREAGIVASTAKHFKKVPEGGCDRMCDVRLACGHPCPRVCHTGTGHELILCLMPCRRACPDCGQVCEGEHSCCDHVHCLRKTEKLIPRCRHTQVMSCGQDPMTAQCRAACRQLLACGHHCQNPCGQPCMRQCQVNVMAKVATCGHQHEARCWEKDTAHCSQPCGEELVCGHQCQGMCGECRRGRLHMACAQKCRKILVCGHNCQASCCQCPPCPRSCQNRCSHSRCDKKCGDACVPCANPCEWECKHHKCTRQCGEPCDRERCDEPCPKLLECGHPCRGLCGETCLPFCLNCHPEFFEELSSGKPEEEDRFVFLGDCDHVEEVCFLDRWVDMSRDFQTADTDREAEDTQGATAAEDTQGATAAEDTQGATAAEDTQGATAADDTQGATAEDGNTGPVSRVVKFPECPQCKTPIRRNLRYGNVIKEALNEMEIIKQLCRGDEARVKELSARVDSARRRVPQDLKPQVAALFIDDRVVSEPHLVTQFYQITMAIDTNQLLRQVTSALTRWPDMAATYRSVRSDLEHLLTWTLTPRPILSDQEHFDAHQEFQRLRILLHLVHCRESINEDKIQVDLRVMPRLAATIRQLMGGQPLAENDLEEGRRLQEELKTVVEDPYSALSDEEREAIVKAVSLPTGSWYACPRGHYYVIADCGRPTEVASCPECHAPVGGEQHELAQGNRHAPEFDNAEGPRWNQEEDERFARMLQQEEWNNWH